MEFKSALQQNKNDIQENANHDRIKKNGIQGRKGGCTWGHTAVDLCGGLYIIPHTFYGGTQLSKHKSTEQKKMNHMHLGRILMRRWTYFLSPKI
jgi:hypothetical protein